MKNLLILPKVMNKIWNFPEKKNKFSEKIFSSLKANIWTTEGSNNFVPRDGKNNGKLLAGKIPMKHFRGSRFKLHFP